jgi:hypothetical protein
VPSNLLGELHLARKLLAATPNAGIAVVSRITIYGV